MHQPTKLCCFFFFVVQTFKIYYLGNFQVYNTVLVTIVTMLNLKSLELIHLITGSLYPVTNISPFPLPTGKTTCCIGLSISIVMLLARNAWGTRLGPYYLWRAPQTSPQPESKLWLNHLLWLLLLQKSPQQQPSRNLRTVFITHRSWRIYSTPNGPTVKLQTEREGESMNLGLCLY